MIIVLAGTVEGRQMVSLLNQEGWPNIACVVSRYGAELLARPGFDNIYQGCLDKTGLNLLIKEKKASILLDATHPFASKISELAIEAADECKIHYIRLERTSVSLPDDPLVQRIAALDQIQEFILPRQIVFSTLGSRHLPLVAPLVKRAGALLVARVLPLSGVIRDCEELGLTPNSIVALKGPFSKELNRHLFKHYGAQLILSKESGAAGGLDTKLQAALELKIPIIVWSRPAMNYPLVFHSPEEVMQYIKMKWEVCFNEKRSNSPGTWQQERGSQ